MQTGRRSGNRAPCARVNRLIAVAIARVIGSIDVGGKRHVPDGVDCRVKVTAARNRQSNRPPAERAVRHDFAVDTQRAVGRRLERESGSHLELLSGMHERVPQPLVEPLEQQNLDPPAAGYAVSREPRGKDLAVVDDDEVSRAKPVREVLDRLVREHTGRPFEHQHA